MTLLFLAMDDDKMAHPEYLADEAAVLEAVKRAVFDYRDGSEWDPEHIEEAEGIAAGLLEDGVFHFEGDAPLYLFRLAAGVGEGHVETVCTKDADDQKS